MREIPIRKDQDILILGCAAITFYIFLLDSFQLCKIMFMQFKVWVLCKSFCCSQGKEGKPFFYEILNLESIEINKVS